MSADREHAEVLADAEDRIFAVLRTAEERRAELSRQALADVEAIRAEIQDAHGVEVWDTPGRPPGYMDLRRPQVEAVRRQCAAFLAAADALLPLMVPGATVGRVLKTCDPGLAARVREGLVESTFFPE